MSSKYFLGFERDDGWCAGYGAFSENKIAVKCSSRVSQSLLDLFRKIEKNLKESDKLIVKRSLDP